MWLQSNRLQTTDLDIVLLIWQLYYNLKNAFRQNKTFVFSYWGGLF